MANYYCDELTLPDGRKIYAHQAGYTENDTNAFIPDEDSFKIYWKDSGEELTEDEFNQAFSFKGIAYYLHEYVEEYGNFEFDGYDEPDY